MKAIFLILSFIWLLPALAGDLYYLKPESVDLSLVPPPPADDSDDLKVILELQNNRTAEECTRAGIEAEGFATSFFGFYGPLTMEEAQRLVDFQERLFQEVKFYSRILKDHHARLRPVVHFPDLVKPCIKTPSSNAYPSGHTAVSYVAARTFSLLYPDKSESFMKRAQEIAVDRVLGGVHHPSDIVAGRVLGKLIFEALEKDSKFIEDVRALAK